MFKMLIYGRGCGGSKNTPLLLDAHGPEKMCYASPRDSGSKSAKNGVLRVCIPWLCSARTARGISNGRPGPR